MKNRNIAALVFIGFVISASIFPFALAVDSDYGLQISGSIDTPTQTIAFEGQTHTITSIARTAPDERLTVRVTAPTNADYHVDIYNGDRQHVDSKSGSGNQSVSFNMAGYTPGSYLVVLYQNGNYEAIHPLVVRGYTVTVEDIPSRTDKDATMTVTVTTDKRESVEDLDSVKVILAADDQHKQVTASKTASQTYEATFSLDTFSTGDANVYAVVQGSDTAFKDDRNELLGISDATTVSIEEPTTTTPSTSTTTSTPATTTTSSTPATSTPLSSTSVDTPTQSDTTHPPSSTDTTTTPRPTTASPATSASSDKPLTTTSSTTDDAVITPIQSTTTGTQTTPSSDIPGFGFTAIAMALLGILYLIRRQ